MEFDWEDTSAISENCSFETRDIEESFEDPFALRLLPDSERFSAQARYFNLGRSAAGLACSVFTEQTASSFGSFSLES